MLPFFLVGGEGGRNTGTTPVDRCICCLMSKQNIFFLAQKRVCVCVCVPQIERATKAKHLECKVYFLGAKLELHEIANSPSLQLPSGFFPSNRHGN